MQQRPFQERLTENCASDGTTRATNLLVSKLADQYAIWQPCAVNDVRQIVAGFADLAVAEKVFSDFFNKVTDRRMRFAFLAVIRNRCEKYGTAEMGSVVSCLDQMERLYLDVSKDRIQQIALEKFEANREWTATLIGYAIVDYCRVEHSELSYIIKQTLKSAKHITPKLFHPRAAGRLTSAANHAQTFSLLESRTNLDACYTQLGLKAAPESKRSLNAMLLNCTTTELVRERDRLWASLCYTWAILQETYQQNTQLSTQILATLGPIESKSRPLYAIICATRLPPQDPSEFVAIFADTPTSDWFEMLSLLRVIKRARTELSWPSTLDAFVKIAPKQRLAAIKSELSQIWQ